MLQSALRDIAPSPKRLFEKSTRGKKKKSSEKELILVKLGF